MSAAQAGGALALAFSLTSCVDGGTGTPSPGVGTDGAEETAVTNETAVGLSGDLDVWVMDPVDAEAQEAIDDRAAAFEADHDGVSVAIEYVPWVEAHQRFTAAVTNGQVPDLAEMSTTWTPEFAELGALAPSHPLGDVDFVPAVAESATIGGVMYGIPWYSGATALIYRTDVLADAGVSAPGTWDDLITVGDEIAFARDDIAPIHVAGNYLHMQAPLIWAAGGEIAVRQGGRWTATVDSEAGREAFTFVHSLWKKGWSPEAAVQWLARDVREAFANGQSAMMIGGGWDVDSILSTNPDLEGSLGVALMPAGPSGSRDTSVSGSNLVVFEESDQQELAHAFAEFMVSPEQVTAFTETIGFLPATAAGIEAAVGSDDLNRVFGQQLMEHSRSYPSAAWWAEVESGQVYQGATQQLMQGQQTPAEAAAAVDAGIEEAIR